MFNSTLIARRILISAAFVAAFVLSISVCARAQTQDPAERQRAIDTYESQNMIAALPLLENVAVAYPNDPIVLSRLGFAIYANSVDVKDLATRQKMRDRARSILLKSQSLGDNSNLTKMALDTLSGPDTTQIPFSSIQAAEVSIREGEAAFMRGDMDKAIAAYKRALESDPNLYDAALYAGDSEFKKAMASTDPRFRNDHFEAAGVWFGKAIAINANIETAYRYWGDALDAQGKMNEARDKFIDAIVAEPYGRRAYVGLTQWAQRHKALLGHPHIVPPNSTTTQGANTTLNIDPRTLDSKDGSNEWLMYDLTRIAWQKGDFAKNYPAEPAYRHSLKEETAALRMVAEACAKDLKSGKVKELEASLETLVKLNDAGLLEAFVLFARPDAGIARDYATYRATSRDKLRRYWLEVAIIPG
ncbi:MAG TPA: tetratricopeptide repeat protein [Pyrinomonadaceae bacterium]|nr:tetratricopeptide repeat protein [Pyrinomonadaceae bacterium]